LNLQKHSAGELSWAGVGDSVAMSEITDDFGFRYRGSMRILDAHPHKEKEPG
jgi:hypothetical protein